MKILLIEDRIGRQEQFTNIDFKDYNIIDNKIGVDYEEVKKELQNNNFELLKEYAVIITHRSAFGESGSKILDKLRYYCEENNKKLVLFSGGISATFYTKQPLEALSLNSKILYSDNLKLFLDNAKITKNSNLLILGYGKNWKLNPLLNTLENIKKFLIKNYGEEFDYDEFEDDVELEILENIIDLKKYKEIDEFKEEDVKEIKQNILKKVNILLGVINE